MLVKCRQAVRPGEIDEIREALKKQQQEESDRKAAQKEKQASGSSR